MATIWPRSKPWARRAEPHQQLRNLHLLFDRQGHHAWHRAGGRADFVGVAAQLYQVVAEDFAGHMRPHPAQQEVEAMGNGRADVDVDAGNQAQALTQVGPDCLPAAHIFTLLFQLFRRFEDYFDSELFTDSACSSSSARPVRRAV